MDKEHLLFLRHSMNLICSRCLRDFCDDCPILKLDSEINDELGYWDDDEEIPP